MGETSDRTYFERLPDKVKPHVAEVARSSGLPQTDDSVERISQCWLDKMKMFDEQVGALKMTEVSAFPMDSPKGALLFTYSGSLLCLGTAAEGKRSVEYASIGLRQDVPDFSRTREAVLEADASVDSVLPFGGGPIKSSSPLFKIVVCGDDVSLEEQENRIREATIFLTNGFVKINRTHLGSPGDGLGQFTLKSMTDYVAKKNGLTLKLARQTIEDFLKVVESGVLLGERVRLGRLGKMFLTKRPARKARVGRHPITGREITIKAKPETFAPRFAPSRYLREKALGAGTDTDGGGGEADGDKLLGQGPPGDAPPGHARPAPGTAEGGPGPDFEGNL